MKSSFRWYGDSDPVTLDKIRQIPGMRSIVSAVYDVKPGEVWPEESIKHLVDECREHGLIFDVVESIPVTEEIKLGKFISKLDFAQPGQLSIQEACPSPHENVHLCFLMGTEALFQIFIFGKYDDILRDYDEWEVFSPCLLLVDEDFIHYTYINDDGEVMESQVS